LLTALDDLTRGMDPEKRAAQQLHWLDRLSAYALIKNAAQSQQRPAKDRE
jgi:hypothetical protein